ncbi:glutamate--cysteine ligase [Methylotuvimicrobium sp. KM1]|uniref:glutamate--cysteine ligase n=1 Tax=Methylotuvimicrobium sp. KM1 TaxID=3377707 RepID=UPI00384D896B
MGQEISASHYDLGDFDRFHRKLTQETLLLSKLFDRQAFSTRHPVAGFEIEAWLVDDNMVPAPINDRFLSGLNDPLACEELAKFNIELNSVPTPLAGNLGSRLTEQLQTTWSKARHQAENCNAHIIMIGTLPTLKQADLNLGNMSDLNRYRALNEQILHSRGKPIHLDITGIEHLKTDHYDVMMESATTSFQIHTQVPLAIAHHFYNASIIASAPMVALCGNAPYLFGKNLWHESRIPLFEQAIETGGYAGAAQGPVKRVSFGTGYARKTILECFQENLDHFPILLPEDLGPVSEIFEHLKLHNGTIWRWNRPLIGFDDDGTPHIRIEHRTPAAGPTVIDAIANALFFYGLTKNLCDEIIDKGITVPFSQAKDNFYQAARYGLESPIAWLDGVKHRMQSLFVAELVARAVMGLKSLGISRCDIEDFLGIVQHRIATKQTGSQWQRDFMTNNPDDFTAMTRQYLVNQNRGKPVSEWLLI